MRAIFLSPSLSLSIFLHLLLLPLLVFIIYYSLRTNTTRSSLWAVLPQMSRWSHHCWKNCNNIVGVLFFFYIFIIIFSSSSVLFLFRLLSCWNICILSFAWVDFYCYCCRVLCAVLLHSCDLLLGRNVKIIVYFSQSTYSTRQYYNAMENIYIYKSRTMRQSGARKWRRKNPRKKKAYFISETAIMNVYACMSCHALYKQILDSAGRNKEQHIIIRHKAMNAWQQITFI